MITLWLHECAWLNVTSWPMATAAQGAERWDEEKQRQAELTVQRALANWKAQQQELPIAVAAAQPEAT